MTPDRLSEAVLQLAWQVRSLPPEARRPFRGPLNAILVSSRELRSECRELRAQVAVLRRLLKKDLSEG